MNSKKTKFDFKDEHGAITVLVAIIIVVLLGFTALTVDVGIAYHNKSLMQSASDSAALAVVNTIGTSIDDKSTKLTGAMSMAIKQETEKYFVNNNIKDFKYDKSNKDNTNIEIYPLNSKAEIIKKLKAEPNLTKAVIFYKVTPTKKDVPGNSYVEIYAQKHTTTLFGNVLNIDALKMTTFSASKCDIILSGNPAVLNYQVVNINASPNKAFNITGPLEDTAIKPILNVTEKIINSGLDILQNETLLIKWLMGGPTTFSCPACGTEGPESDFVNHGSDNATIKYKCPNCGTECDEYENSNKVAANIITSSAVLNGAIHSNGYMNINIDTIRMRNFQSPDANFLTCDNCGHVNTQTEFSYKINPDGTAYYKCPKCGTEYNVPKEEGYKIEDNYVIYENGTRYCLFPRLEVDNFDALKIRGSSANDVYLIGNEIPGSDKLPTVRKSGKNDQAKLWDRDSRINKTHCQFTYKATDKEHNKNILKEPGERQMLLNYMRNRFEPQTSKLTNINVPEATKVESGSTYNVDFGVKLSNGNSWAFTPNRGELVISANDKNANGILDGVDGTAPWLSAEYKDRITKIVINKGIKSINAHAFDGCSNLKEVILPDSLVKIESGAFANCPKLVGITIPASVKTIDNAAFDATLTTVRGVVNTAGYKFANATNRNYTIYNSETDYVNSANTKYNIVLNPTDILRETDIGNNRVLPDAYQIFDNEHEFDFDFDGKVDKIEEMTSGKFTVPQYIQNVHDGNHWDITDEEANVYDNARIILDRIVTSYTGDIHDVSILNPNDKEYDKKFKALFDINVVKAIKSRSGEIKNTINSLDNALNAPTKHYFTPDANPVDDYYNAIMPQFNVSVKNRLMNNKLIGTSDKAEKIFNQVKTKDNKLATDIIAEQGCSTWPEVKATDRDKKTYIAKFDMSPGQKGIGNYETYDQKSHMEINGGASVYIKGYYHAQEYWWGVQYYDTDLRLKAGTPEQPTVLYVGGSNLYDGNAVYLSGSLFMEDNTILIANGNIYIDGSFFQMGNNCHIICNGTVSFGANGGDKNARFLGTGNDADGFVDYWTIIAKNDIRLKNISGDYCGLSPNCLMLSDNYTCHANTTQRGFIYTFSNFNSNGLVTITEPATTTSKAYNSNIYVGKEMTCTDAELNGYLVVERKLNVTGTLKAGLIPGEENKKTPAGGVTLVKGVMRDANGNEVTDRTLATSYDTAATINYANLNHNCRVVTRGPFVVNVGLGMSSQTSEGEHSVLYVDATKPNSDTNGTALKVGKNMALHDRACAYIKGNVEINGKNPETNWNGQSGDVDHSLIMGTDSYFAVIGKMSTLSTINLKAKALLRTTNVLNVGGDLRIGTVSNDPAELVNTKLTAVDAKEITFTNVNNDANVRNIFHCYNASVYVKENLTPKLIGIDDNACVYVGGNICSADAKISAVKFWDNGRLYVAGSIYSAGRVGTSNDAESTCQLFVGGEIIADGGVYADHATDILVNKKITCSNGDLRVGSKGSIFAREGITYNGIPSGSSSTTGDIEIQYILYSDGSILNSNQKGNILAGTPDYVRAKNRTEKTAVIPYAHLIGGLNIVRIIPKEPANSVNISYKDPTTGDIATVPKNKCPYTPPQCKNGQSLRISKNTILKVDGDLILDGNIENYGQIIVEGNIYVNSKFAYIRNYNLIYCGGNFIIKGTNKLGDKQNGLSLQNGSYTDSDARIYVKGNLETKACFDNYGKTYIGGNLITTNGLEGASKFSGWGVGYENNTNSLLMLGGSLDTKQGFQNIFYDRPSHTIAKNNSFMFVGGDLTTSASLMIGKSKFAESSMESGQEQYNFMSSNMYKGLDKPDNYFIICDKNDPDMLYEVDSITDTKQPGRKFKDDIWYITLDKNGKQIQTPDYFNGVAKYIKKSDKPLLNSNCYAPYNADFAFVYIKGKVLTGKSNSKSDASIGYIYNTLVYGKSILYVEAKNLPKDINALETGYIHIYPFARFYVGGNAYTSHNDSDFKYKFSESERWRSQESFTNGNSAELWYFSRTWINGSLLFNDLDYSTYGGRKFVMHDAAKCYINGSCTPREYVEIGKPISKNSIDILDGSMDSNGNYINATELQVDGEFTIVNASFKSSYLTVFPRATLNANGDVMITSVKDLTTDGIRIHHHGNLRTAGKMRAGVINIGSCANVNVGKDLNSLKSIHIYDRSNVNVGGNGGGSMVSILGKIEIGQHEREQYKYNTWEQNDQSQDTDITGGNINSGTADGKSEDYLREAQIECPFCGKVGSVKDGDFLLSSDVNIKGYHEYTCLFCSTKDKKSVFDETYPIFVDDGQTLGANVYVNGTIKSIFSSIHLYAKSQAYANESIRSYLSITLDKKAGLYVNPKVVGDDGILYDYDKSTKQLLDSNGHPIPFFFVETDTTSSEFGNIYYFNPKNSDVIIDDPTNEPSINEKVDVANTKFFGFSVDTIPKETVPKEDSLLDIFFNPTKNVEEKSYGYLTQNDNIYYYKPIYKTDESGNVMVDSNNKPIIEREEQIYPYTATQDADGTKITYHYGISGTGSSAMLVKDNGNDDFVGQQIISTTTTDSDGNTTSLAQEIALKTVNGSITSYGPLTVDDDGVLYATSNITAYGKTFIGDKAIVYTENGNFRSLKLISLSSLINGKSVCGFEMEHGTLYAGKNIFILSCADIEGGTIFAYGGITFDSIYVKYQFNPKNIHTDSTQLDMCICSETGDVNFNSIFNVLGGFVYAPNGNLNVNGTYFEHSGAYIGDQVNINAFYIAFHRLPNISTVDLKWAKPGDVYLCDPIS